MHRNKKVGWIALVLGVSVLCGSVAVASPGVRLDGTIQESGLSLAGGTLTGPVCWYDTSSSVCIDSTTAGQLSIYGSGATNNEDLVCDVETTANVIALSSSTGVTQITAAGMDLNPATVTLGAGDVGDSGVVMLPNNSCFVWEADPTGADETLCVDANEWLIYSGPIISETGVGGYLVAQDSTNPGNASGEGYVNFKAYSDTLDDNIVMSQIALDVVDASDGAEYADTVISTIENGALTEYMRMNSTAGAIVAAKPITVGAGGQWKAGTDDDGIILQEVGDAGDNVCLKTVTDALYVHEGDCTAYATMRTGTQTNYGGYDTINNASNARYAAYVTADGAANQGQFVMFGDDAGGTLHTFGRIHGELTASGAGVEMHDMVFESTTNGTDATEYMRLDSSAGVVDVSTNLSVDFHNNLCLDGVTCTTYIAEEVDNYLYFYAGGNKQLVLCDNAYNMYTAGAALDNYVVRTGTPATDVDIQVQRFYGESSNGTDTEFVAVTGGIAEHTQGDVDGVWELEVKNDNSHVSVIKADMSDGVENLTIGVPIVSSVFSSDNADPADAGVIRLGNAEEIRWESSPASANEGRLWVSSSETLNYRNGSNTGSFSIDVSGGFGWNTRSFLNSPADGQVCGKNQAESSGACFDFDDADGTVVVKDRAGTGAGNLTASTITATVGLVNANGTALPGTCVVGQVFLDTDSDDCADTGSGDGCICICKSTDTWAVVQDI